MLIWQKISEFQWDWFCDTYYLQCILHLLNKTVYFRNFSFLWTSMEIITITIFSQSSYSPHFILWKDKRLISPVSCPVVSYCLQPGEALVRYLSRFLRTSLLAQETVVVPLPVRVVCFFRAGTGNRKVHKDSKWCSLDQSGAWCHQRKSDSCVGLFHLAFFALSDGPRLTACFCICMWFRAHVRQMFLTVTPRSTSSQFGTLYHLCHAHHAAHRALPIV